MKNFILTFILLLPFTLHAVLISNELSKVPLKKVYADSTDAFIRVSPPLKFLEKSTEEKTCSIQVTYNDFSDNAKEAFEYAVSIWETLLVSDQIIYVDATWRKFEKEGDETVLGAAGSADFYINKEGFSENNVFFNAPLAEKIAGRGINKDGFPDIYAYFNSEADWYYGTDGVTPSGKYDLVSVVLHELCHGLGFLGSMDINSKNEGLWGFGTQYPFSWDRFVINKKGEHLIDLTRFNNPSSVLYQEYVSDELYFEGPILRSNTNSNAKLYVPSEFSEGSSIDHLNESTYDNTAHSLMTPSISRATSIHNPGLITLSMMQDMGWSNIRIEHEKVANKEEVSNVKFQISVYPDFETDIIDPSLHYVINNKEEVVTLEKNGSLYHVEVPIAEEVEIDYYFTLKDKYDRLYSYPNTAPDKPLQLLIGPDMEAPEISHIQDNIFISGESELVLLCDVSDTYGIDGVWVEYYINEDEKTPLPLNIYRNDSYNVVIDFSEIELNEGDSIRYKLFAKDNSSNENIAVEPESGYHTLIVSGLPEFVTSYEMSFETGANEFDVSGFAINIAKGFNNAALNSEHPYENAGEDNYFNFTANLKYPIKIAAEDHLISFDEIVLVEPGEPETVYGDEEFWDYVTVEGALHGDTVWIPFDGAWDCRLHNEWYEAYQQSLSFNNTDILEDLDLYRNHTVDLTAPDEFSIGDIIDVRFRLHSDPFATGWGWAIDNLRIQTIGVDVEDLTTETFKVFPNPVKNGHFSIEGINENIDRIRLYDFSGKLVYFTDNFVLGEKINVGNELKGFHILYIEASNFVYQTKLIFK